MNIDELKKVVVDISQVVNAISKFLAKQGISSLFGAIAPLQALALIDWAKVKAEILDLDISEKADLENTLKANLQLVNPAAQAKLIAAVDCVDQAVSLVSEGVGLYNQGKSLVEKVKQLIGA